ncbi:MAG: terpene cyclase/mutase family protein [Phycisphaerales bacterium]|nr:terpene cyclase/mutase family protein [Phycisphaerales bacterium]
MLAAASQPALDAPATVPTTTPATPAAASAPSPAAPNAAPAIPRATIDEAPARPAGMASSAQNSALEREITPQLERAVDRGLAALAAMQNPDGSFGSSPSPNARNPGRNVAITSLACLAFLADGHAPGRGKYASVVERGLENVLASSNETGLIANDSSGSPMYGHGFATLFLGEIYGMTAAGGDTPQARRVHAALVRACRLIERTQNEEGGWRYNPVPVDADVSVTISQIMALRSARNAGIEIPKITIDRAVEYVRKCQNPDGGFMYQLPSGMSLWPRSAAGVASLYYAGIYQDQAIDNGLKYLLDTAMPNNPGRMEPHYWYGQYYLAQSMYLAGGTHWATWWPLARAEMLDRQLASGTWLDSSFGPAYGTSMALIVLQMPKRYLPIFQK